MSLKRLAGVREACKRLGEVTAQIYDFVQVGVSPWEIEQEARRLIKAQGGQPSFMTVDDYQWATCINLNNGVVHGIPISKEPLVSGDLVTVDLGLLLNGFHSDNAFSKVVGQSTPEKDRFLQAGREAIQAALNQVKSGAYVGSISQATENVLRKYGYSPAIGLTGHGVGRHLHEDPMIPCLLTEKIEHTPRIRRGQTLAIEIIYLQGSPELVLLEDDWTIVSRDGKLAAVFEETVEVTDDGYSILTYPALFQR